MTSKARIPIKPHPTPLYMGLAHDIECGLLHSGLPSCCVAYFISDWMALSQDARDSITDHATKLLQRRAGYVRCPRCVKENVAVTVKPCSCKEVIAIGQRIQYNIDSGELVKIPGTNGYVHKQTGKRVRA